MPACTETGADPVRAWPDALATWPKDVEGGPLYAAARAASGAVACHLERRSGAWTLRFDFANGGRFEATRDDRIEYAEQVARLASMPVAAPVDVLKRAETASFGPEGCSIAWSRPEISRPESEAGATDTVFRGTTCNCQARMRRDASGRTVELAFKSAC